MKTAVNQLKKSIAPYLVMCCLLFCFAACSNGTDSKTSEKKVGSTSPTVAKANATKKAKKSTATTDKQKESRKDKKAKSKNKKTKKDSKKPLTDADKKKLENSVKENQAAIAKDAKNVKAYNTLCVAYIKLGKYDKAIESCKKGLALKPDGKLVKANLKWAEKEKLKNQKKKNEQQKK